MISLLRKFRQKLLQEGKTANYLKYAIGEIVLVVLGILIALQVNNWNEQRKDKIKSISYLERLNKDLDFILIDVENSILTTERNLNNSIIVLEALEKKDLPISKQPGFERYLNQYYWFQFTIQDANTFNEMLSAGELNLIENRWIREAFSNLAGHRDFIMKVNGAHHQASLENAERFDKYIRYHFENFDTDSVRSVPSFHFDTMTTDAQLINMVSRQAKSWRSLLGMFKNYHSDVLQIKDSIQFELN